MTLHQTLNAIGLALAICAALALTPADARGGGHGGGHSGGHSSHSYSSHSGSSGFSSVRSHSSRSYQARGYSVRRSRTVVGVTRESHGRIARSTKAKDAFKHQHPCPATGRSTGGCPGYVIDHVTALKRGGRDDPSNMQWQTVTDAKAKDKVE